MPRSLLPKERMRSILLIAFGPIPIISAQAVSFGLVAGAPFNDVVKTGFASPSAIQSIPKSANFTIGASLQVRLPKSVGFEADFLYHPYDLNLNSIGLGLVGVETTTRISASQFRVPLLLQYRFRTPVIKPLVEAGASIDHLGNVSASTTTVISIPPETSSSSGGIPTAGPGHLKTQSNVGIVFGGGAEIKIAFVRVSGEVRYSRDGEYFRRFPTSTRERS